MKPTVKQDLGVPGPLLGQTPCAVQPQLCIPFVQIRPGPSGILPQALGSERTIPGRAWWSLELSRALIHDLILRRAITQSPVLFLAAKCRREMGYVP